MAKVKLKLQNKNDSELLTFSQQHIAAMATNPNFGTPFPAILDYQALHDEFEAKLDESDMAAQSSKEKTALKDAARFALEAALNQRGAYVESTSGGDEAVILSSNLSVRNLPAPIGPVAAPVGLLTRTGRHDGQIDLTWSPVRGAKSYIIQHSASVTPRVWVQKTVLSRSRHSVTDCTPGETCVFRVAAVGAAGQGPWSDESTKRAP